MWRGRVTHIFFAPYCLHVQSYLLQWFQLSLWCSPWLHITRTTFIHNCKEFQKMLHYTDYSYVQYTKCSFLPFLFTNCSCRVYGYSFYIGLLIPFGAIYIMNWILFILIFANLVCKSSVRQETSKNGNLRKLKENFMIALGLSLLFGIGWAIGLLATSDLPDAVRYPAEWVFTLTTAFLGVYLFVLHVLKPQETRRLWKRWLLCQRKRAAFGVSTSNTSKSRLTSTIVSWAGTFRHNTLGEAGQGTVTLTCNIPAASENLYSSSSLTGRTTDITSTFVEPSSAMENTTSMATSPHLPHVEIKLVCRLDQDEQSNIEEPVKADIDTESIIETMSFHDSSSLLGFNAFSVQHDPPPTGTDGDCYIVQNKETEGL